MQDRHIRLPHPPTVITPQDTLWPKQLADLSDPPLQLRVAGELQRFRRTVAIVGTRYADEEALQFTRELAAHLAYSGLITVSGGAYGIDAAAHEGALMASGRTVAVLATGLRLAYPPRHRPLFERIARSGALITEVPNQFNPRPGLFLRRNRLIAALADTVVIVQAPSRSGALSTAKWAKRLNRNLLVVPSAPWDPRGAGCLKLIQQGARICTSPYDVLSNHRSEKDSVVTFTKEFNKNGHDLNNFDDDEKKVLKNLSRMPSHPDEVSRKTGLQIPHVQQLLLRLMLQGIVEERSGGKYVKNR